MSYRRARVCLVLLFAAQALAFTKTRPTSWNDAGKIATIESLVERHTWAIDASPWRAQTADVVRVRQVFYSAALPLLPLVGAGLYCTLRGVFGLRLDPGALEKTPLNAYYWLSLGLCCLPALFLIFLFHRGCETSGATPLAAALATASLAFASMVGPYSACLNAHLPAAAALFGSFHLLRSGPRPAWALACAGALTGLAIACDLLSAPLALGLLLFALARHQRAAWPFLVGACVPLGVTALLNQRVGGSVVPVFLLPGAYDYEKSAFAAVTARPERPLSYAFHSLLGLNGVFQYSPNLLFGVAGLIAALRSGAGHRRAEALCVGAGLALLFATVLFGTSNYGGNAYGERYLLSGVPFLLAFLIFAPPLRSWGRASATLLVLATAVSAVSSAQGLFDPWQRVPPPLLAPLVSRPGIGP